MGRVEGSTVEEPEVRGSALAGYARLDGVVPVFYPPGLEERAARVRDLLESGASALSEILAVEPPELEALLVADEDREDAPREHGIPYPPGLPYFTRAARPPALVLPETLSPAFRPRTDATGALVVWHELAHAFLLREPVPRTPAWLRELIPQTLSAAVARRASLQLDEHLEEVERSPGLTVGGSGEPRSDAAAQMAFQNVLLTLGAAALERFGEGFLRTLAHAVWSERDVICGDRAKELLAESLGPDGWRWLLSRPEFRGN